MIPDKFLSDVIKLETKYYGHSITPKSLIEILLLALEINEYKRNNNETNIRTTN